MGDYRLGAGDAVRILVFQNADLALETRLSESGVVRYPLLGVVKLAGLTVQEAEHLIEQGLREGRFVRHPQVSVVVTQVRGHQASVLGHVNRPGRFPLESGELRLSELLAIAGGITPAGADLVTVVGDREGKPWRLEVDLPAVFDQASRESDPWIRGGDVVYVERAPLVYIYGEVQRPGPVRMERGMTVQQLLASGGGLTLRGTERGLRLHRRDGQGHTVQLQPPLDEPVRPGDVIQVRESWF